MSYELLLGWGTFLAECKSELVITQVKGVALFYPFSLHSLPVVLNAVGTIEVLDEVVSAAINDRAMFTGNVSIANRKVGDLTTTADDKAVFVETISLAVEQKVHARSNRFLRASAGLWRTVG